MIVRRLAKLAASATLIFATNGVAQTIPNGFVVPECTLSPDRRYGVTVPILGQHDDHAEPKNSVVEVKTGKVIAVIRTANTGWNRMAHGGVLPCRWSREGSLLLWEIDGKWFPAALVLVKFENGALLWQTDVLAIAQAKILQRTRHASPNKYAKAKQANAGKGSAYPEGFSIYVAAIDPISFPVHVRATLTSDPKEIEGRPILESSLTGVVDHHGRFFVAGFHVGRGLWRQFVDTVSSPEPCNFAKAYER